MISYIASERQYVDHLAPLFLATGGEFICAPEIETNVLSRGIVPKVLMVPQWAEYLQWRRGPLIAGAYGDYARVRNIHRPIVFVNHGNGQSFVEAHQSYSGGPNRDNVRLFLEPNEFAASKTRATYPQIETVIVGCPKLDDWAGKEREKTGIVCVSFHWDGRAVPEMRSAWPHYKRHLQTLTDHFRVIGHAHPRIYSMLEKRYRKMGIEPVPTFEEVLDRADVYVNDCSSTLYEFAATGRPVVVMNAPWYRRDVEHGLRFWEWAGVGVNVNQPEGLVSAIHEAIADSPAQRRQRGRAVRAVYPYLGRATSKAAGAIRRLDSETPEDDHVKHLYSAHRKQDGTWEVHGSVMGERVTVTADLGDNPSVKEALAALSAKDEIETVEVKPKRTRRRKAVA